jgi:hypothetical protein
MPNFAAFLQSLLVASAVSFVAPLSLIGLSLAFFLLIGQIPLVEVLARSGFESVIQFLITFGGGSALQGALVIGATCGLVGALFDIYAFYQQHHWVRS